MMQVKSARPLHTDDQQPDSATMLDDVLAGLSLRPRSLPSKYFYDRHGSALFEEICRQPEYYLTRAELALMETHIGSIVDALGPGVELVEPGSGSGIKTRMLLQNLEDPVACVPVEISSSALRASATNLAQTFPDLEVLPVVADFTGPVDLPSTHTPARRKVVYFPGSTLGNFEPAAAMRLLRSMRRVMGEGGVILLGVDRVKDPAVIKAAYNDAAGVTARFTLNMLARFNRELDADFRLDAFRHRSRYNKQAERVETFLDSCCDQDVHIAGRTFHFCRDEPILVEFSCKYSSRSLAALAAHAGLAVQREWRDPEQLFSLFLLVRS